MAIKMKDLRDKVTTVEVKWDGETADIGFYAARFTPALMESIQAEAEKENLQMLGLMLEPILAWWDLLDDEGDRLPTDAATIKEMPFGLLTTIISATQESMRPPAQKG